MPKRKRKKPKKQKPPKIHKQVYRDQTWEKSKLGALGSRVSNSNECFECHECGHEFRTHALNKDGMPHMLSFPCRREDCCNCSGDLCGWEWCSACRRALAGGLCGEGSCPNCGSKYVEWLSYDTPWEDIYFSSEWKPDGRMCPGEVEIR